MDLYPEQILPSQSFLKPDTIRFIFECYEKNDLGSLPPPPIVRKDNAGNLIAIDGHNLIAVKLFRGETIDVHLATHADDGLPVVSDANQARNQDLKEKFDLVLAKRELVEAEGVVTFWNLIARYPKLFPLESSI